MCWGLLGVCKLEVWDDVNHHWSVPLSLPKEQKACAAIQVSICQFKIWGYISQTLKTKNNYQTVLNKTGSSGKFKTFISSQNQTMFLDLHTNRSKPWNHDWAKLCFQDIWSKKRSFIFVRIFYVSKIKKFHTHYNFYSSTYSMYLRSKDKTIRNQKAHYSRPQIQQLH